MTLQELLHARVGGDPRSHVAAIEVYGGRVRILFGEVGGHQRITLGVEDNRVSILTPRDLADPAPAPTDDGADKARIAELEQELANAKAAPVQVELAGGLIVQLRDGALYADDKPLYLSEDDPVEVSALVDDLTAKLEAATAAPAPAGGDNGAGGDNSPAEGETPADEAGTTPAEAIDPKAHNRDALVNIAKDESVEHKADATKAEIAAAINAKRGIPAA